MRSNSGRNGSIPPAFGLPPAIQWISRKDSSAFSAASALVAFESLMNSTRPRRPTSSIRCARPGKVANARGDRVARHAERGRGGVSEGGVLAVVGAAQRPGAPEVDRRLGGVARENPVIVDENVRQRRRTARDGHALVVPAGALMRAQIARLGSSSTPIKRDPGLGDQPLLDRRIALEVAVTVEMVRRDVDQEADARRERGGEVDLVGRALDHMDTGFGRWALSRGSARRYCRRAPRRAQLP